jgi:hypothetical protein
MDYQGRSEQFLWYGPNSKMAPLKFLFELWGRNCAPHIFFSDFGAEMAPSSLNMRPFSGGGGCKRWYFCQICAPETTPLRAAAPQAPPLLRPCGLCIKLLFFFNDIVVYQSQSRKIGSRNCCHSKGL